MMLIFALMTAGLIYQDHVYSEYHKKIDACIKTMSTPEEIKVCKDKVKL